MTLSTIGKHNAISTACQLGKSGTGKDQICITFLLDDGSTKSAWLFLTDAALPATEKQLRNMGWDPTAPENQWDLEMIHETDRLVQVETVVEIAHELAQDGKTMRDRIKWIGESGGGNANPLEKSEVKAVVADLRARLRMAGGAKPAAAKKAAPPQPPPSKPAAPKAADVGRQTAEGLGFKQPPQRPTLAKQAPPLQRQPGDEPPDTSFNTGELEEGPA